MPRLPTGLVITFMFTDIEGSTALFQELGDRYLELLHDHHSVVRQAIADHGGHEVSTEGDAFFIAFQEASAAVAASLQIQREMSGVRTAEDRPLRLRIGMHSGSAHVVCDDYVGLAVHKAARITAAAHGGQVLLSDEVAELAGHSLPARASLRNLGPHVLKDFPEAGTIRQLVHPDLPDIFPPPRTLSTTLHNLPAPPTPMVGRRTQLDLLQKLLLSEARIVTLTGMAGVGKTRLALEAAWSLLAYFRGGVWFAPLVRITDRDEFLPAVSSCMNEPGGVAHSPLGARSGEPVLLVLDNLEQVNDGATRVAALASRCPKLRVLTTSRERLQIRGEHVVQVKPLATPPLDATRETLCSYESVELFVKRASAVLPGLGLEGDRAALVARICKSLGGLPLALELAAAGASDRGLETVANGIGCALDIPGPGLRDLPSRQRSLRSAIEWSYRLLDDEEQQLFERASAFPGGFTAAVAEARLDTPEVERTAKALVAKSLFSFDEGTGRYTMLEPVRQFAAEKLAAREDSSRLRGPADLACAMGDLFRADRLLEDSDPAPLDQQGTSSA